MKATQFLAPVLATIVLMGCQIEVTPLDSAQITTTDTTVVTEDRNSGETVINETTNTVSTQPVVESAPAVEAEPVVVEAEQVIVEEPVIVEAPVVEEEQVIAEAPVVEEAPAVEPEPSITSVTLYWSAPVERVNGEAMNIADIGGYEVRYKADSDENYTNVVVNGASEDQYTIENLTNADQYTFEVAVFDNDGIYSDFVVAMANEVNNQ